MRIAVFLDGTWSDEDQDTNIAKMHANTPQIPGSQTTEYVPGVGTTPGLKWTGGIFARGLDDKIIDGYTRIARQYQDGDDIFLIGYSRGAFTARSLAGMIAKCGVLRPEKLAPASVYARYRDTHAPGLRELRAREQLPRPGRAGAEDKLVLNHATLLRIRFIGVFDTVGSLGIPGTLGSLFAGRYAFHDTRLSGLVDHARHAIALDERRASFQPTLWTSVPIPVPGGGATTIEQRWFVGAHSNIGGGRPRRDKDNLLSTITHAWMTNEAAAAGLQVNAQPPPPDAYRGWIEPSNRRFPFNAASAFLPGLKDQVRPVRTTNLNETLDESVPKRWADFPDYHDRNRPPNPGLWPWIQELRAARGLPPLPDD